MKKRELLFLLISGFTVVVAWIGFSIYHNLATSTISSTVGNQLRPIPGNFDTQNINKLKERKKVSPNFVQLDTSTATQTPQITNIPTPVPTIPIATEPATIATEGASL